ncbi:MAG: hypothetical protein HOP08_19540 [Cyclobacteriaceae bacterium]|nr:hypothetical protein [Cyclobacteriaceae bacterium]
MNLTKILTVVLLGASLYLGYYLYSGVQKVIDDRAVIESTEAAVIEKLKLIREAESVYQEQNGRYTASWDTLVRFIETGRVPILQRKEIIEQQAYGGEKVTIKTDTLGFVSAKERIFKKNYSMNATEDGTFMGYKVKVGDVVVKNMKAYSIKVSSDRTNEPPFQEKGTVESLADLKAGDAVTKGKMLINYSNYVFNPNTDLTKIGEVPGNPGLMFDIYVKKIDRNGLMVDVIEVKDPKPINPARKDSNEQKTRKPLRFGSRTDVATAGNWE